MLGCWELLERSLFTLLHYYIPRMSTSESSSFSNNYLPRESNTTIINESNGGLKRPKRMCRFPGCPNVIKSQGHCQRHGAIVKRCKVENCMRQVQGQFNGMCTRHYKESLKQESNVEETKVEEEVPVDVGPSVYDRIIPDSLVWKQGAGNSNINNNSKKGNSGNEAKDGIGNKSQNQVAPNSNHNNSTATSLTFVNTNEMPLIEFLRSGMHLEPGWHRKNERLIQDPKHPLLSLGERLTPEEKQLLMLEKCLLSGTIYYNSLSNQVRTNKELEHAWGKSRNVVKRAISEICERRGDTSRSKRYDTGIKKVKVDVGTQPVNSSIHTELGEQVDLNGSLNLNLDHTQNQASDILDM